MASIFQMGIASGTRGSPPPPPPPPPAPYDPATQFAAVTVAPSFVIYNAKLVASYTGPAFRVLRPSDGQELDIGFGADNRIDETALFAFLGSEVGQVVRRYDQSGNGRHEDPQLTAAYRARISSGNPRHNGNLTFLGTGTNGLRYTIPGHVTNRRDHSIYSIGEYEGATLGVMMLDNTSSPLMEFANQVETGTSPDSQILAADLRPSIYEMHASPTSNVHTVNADSRTRGLSSNFVTTGAQCNVPNSSYGTDGYQSGWIGYPAQLSAANRTALKDAITYASGVNYGAIDGRVVFIGDSITVGLIDPNNYGWSRRTHAYVDGNLSYHQDAASGRQLANYLTNYNSSTAKTILSKKPGSLAFVLKATNDLLNGAKTDTDMAALIQTLAANVHADGCQVMVATILPMKSVKFTPTVQGYWEDYNDWLRANWASFADGLCDFQADPVVGPVAAADDVSLYPDGIHPSSYCHDLLAQISAAALNDYYGF
jgi:lysophospholipase L1-like esterase